MVTRSRHRPPLNAFALDPKLREPALRTHLPVDVAMFNDGTVAVISNKELDKEPLFFTGPEWLAFRAGAMRKEFDTANPLVKLLRRVLPTHYTSHDDALHKSSVRTPNATASRLFARFATALSNDPAVREAVSTFNRAVYDDDAWNRPAPGDNGSSLAQLVDDVWQRQETPEYPLRDNLAPGVTFDFRKRLEILIADSFPDANVRIHTASLGDTDVIGTSGTVFVEAVSDVDALHRMALAQAFGLAWEDEPTFDMSMIIRDKTGDQHGWTQRLGWNREAEAFDNLLTPVSTHYTRGPEADGIIERIEAASKGLGLDAVEAGVTLN